MYEIPKSLSFTEYQQMARKTAIYPTKASVTYPLIGLIGEVGEFANKYKKTIRDGTPMEDSDIIGELGDCLWYLSNIASDLGITLNDIAIHNLEKLFDRKDRGVLGGSGDNR